MLYRLDRVVACPSCGRPVPEAAGEESAARLSHRLPISCAPRYGDGLGEAFAAAEVAAEATAAAVVEVAAAAADSGDDADEGGGGAVKWLGSHGAAPGPGRASQFRAWPRCSWLSA